MTIKSYKSFNESLEENLIIDLYDLIKTYKDIPGVFKYLENEILPTHILYKIKMLDDEKKYNNINIDKNIMWFSKAGSRVQMKIYKEDVLKLRDIFLYFKKSPPRVYSVFDPYGEEDWDN